RLVLGMAEAILQCRSQSGADPTVALEEVSLAGDVQGHPWLARVARGVMTAVVVVRKQEGWRLDGCRDLIECCRLDGDSWGQLLMTLTSSIAAGRVGEHEAAAHFLRSAGELAEALDAPVLRLWVDCIAEMSDEAWDRSSSPLRRKDLDRTALSLGIEDVESIRDVARDLCATGLRSQPLLHTSGEAVIVRCLGGFAIETAKGQVDLTGLRPRARTLLMALAAQCGRDIHRERLEEMLWPGVPSCRAKHSLQVAVSSVRRVLAAAGVGPEAVQRRGDSYRLHIDGAMIDVSLFEEWVCRGVENISGRPPSHPVEQAMAVFELYRGDLLPEVGNAEWVVWERDRLRQEAAAYAVQVAQLCLDASLHSQGITTARRALELDPYQDAAWIVLAQLQEGGRDATAAALTRAKHGDIRRELDVRVSFTQPRGDDAHERVSASRRTR
ncbi:MAG: BTAD domain-containing putative transcriptional regulator, partial [Ornithinimicrobium sp.]